MGEKKKKKKKGTTVGTLTTTTLTRIPIPLIEKRRTVPTRETLQSSTIKRKASNFSYLENAGPSGLELQKKTLEKAARRKVAMEAAKARGEVTSSQ